MGSVYTIPSAAPFIATLAEGLWQQSGCNWLTLSAGSVFLPTRRACRLLREHFLHLAQGQAVLLPRLLTFGEFEPDDPLLLTAGVQSDLPPPLTKFERLMLLARLIQEKHGEVSGARAFQLAQSLGDFLDELQIEQVAPEKLQQIVPEKFRYAEHWQRLLDFLDVVVRVWPEEMKKLQRSDPILWRQAQMQALAAAWQVRPPRHPVTAAGSTGTHPTTAVLLAAVAALPQGQVVLPGLDQSMAEEDWQTLEETHPQAALKRLVARLGSERKTVALWPPCQQNTSPRAELLQAAFGPTDKVSARSYDASGLQIVTAETLQEEATVIALAIRKALAEAEKTVALVTPDRALAERVRLLLQRWNITADDSAGMPLPKTRLGHFLNLLLAAAHPLANAVEWLALLQHPLAAFGHSPQHCRQMARLLERYVWRGPRLAEGLQAVIRRLNAQQKIPERDDLQNFVLHVDRVLQRLRQTMEQSAVALEDIVLTHMQVAEAAAASDTIPGAELLWQGQDGDAVKTWAYEISQAAALYPKMAGIDYPALFAILTEAVTVRPFLGQHPRVMILGLLEARLTQADLFILGGLNEGVWPAAPPVDPWLSRPMRRDCGLPSPERRIALAAHDFVQLASQPQVLMTRSLRDATAPTVPSRFITRLQTALQAVGQQGSIEADTSWLAWARGLDWTAHIRPMPPPSPRPALAVRPASFYVSDLSLLRQNPYGYYAKKILGFKKLNDLLEDISDRHYGIAMHSILERALRTSWPTNQEAARALLFKHAQEVFSAYADNAYVAAFWWPSFRAACEKILQNEADRSLQIAYTAVEVEGRASLALAGQTVTLSGRADRIDVLNNGHAEVIDYKTNAPPEKKRVDMGVEPQLILLSWLLQQGGFPGVDCRTLGGFSYRHLVKTEGGEEKSRHWDHAAAMKVIDSIMPELLQLIERYLSMPIPYLVRPRPDFDPSHDDYEHLARKAEWGEGA